MDLLVNSSLRAFMDDETKSRIQKLCAEIGSIMEDASVVAVVWKVDDGLSTKMRVGRLVSAHSEIGKLLSEVCDLTS